MSATRHDFEKRLRRRLLQTLDAGNVGFPMRGEELISALAYDRVLRDLVKDDALATEESVILRLCRDLVNSGLATITDQRRLVKEKPSAENTAFSITAKGTALLAGAVPVEPLVEDERI